MKSNFDKIILRIFLAILISPLFLSIMLEAKEMVLVLGIELFLFSLILCIRSIETH